jgi:hypothetical protein
MNKQSDEQRKLFEMHEDMETVDEIPNEELNQQVKDEANKDETKSNSSSDR